MVWFSLGLLYSVFQACFNELNRIYKIDSWQLNFLHCLFATLVLSPCVLFVSSYLSWVLIAASMVLASFITIGCQAQIFMSATHNGRVGSIHRPISIFVAFIFWIGFFPETAAPYMEDKVSLTLILSSFVLIIFSVVLIRKNDIGWNALLIMAPVGVLYGFAAVISKYVMDGEQTLMQALTFSFVTYFFMMVFSMLAAFSKKKLSRELLSPFYLKAGLAIGLSSVIAYVLMLLSIVYAPNPAFTSVIGSLAPVWIMIYHRFVGLKDEASPMVGLVMIAASILLVVATL